MLALGGGITPDMVRPRRASPTSDLVVLEIGTAGDSVGFRASEAPEFIEFPDGTVWTRLQLLNRILAEQATAGADTIRGFAEGRVITGEEGDDALFGGGQADEMSGGPGADTIRGENGRDTIYGGRGNDQLYGGRHEDVFVFGPGSGSDIVVDFAISEDVLEIMAGGANFSRQQFLNGAVATTGGVEIRFAAFGDDFLLTLNGVRPEQLSDIQVLVVG
jgi:Ca2+-binding RTX toxin-like protein